MNNQEKNTYVREQLTKALIQLLQEKRIEDISVSELTQRAQVGRASFYRNYQSLSDILYQYDRLLVNTWGAAYDADPASNISNLFGRLFQHYKDHADFYLLLYQRAHRGHAEHHSGAVRPAGGAGEPGGIREGLLGLRHLRLADGVDEAGHGGIRRRHQRHAVRSVTDLYRQGRRYRQVWTLYNRNSWIKSDDLFRGNVRAVPILNGSKNTSLRNRRFQRDVFMSRAVSSGSVLAAELQSRL